MCGKGAETSDCRGLAARWKTGTGCKRVFCVSPALPNPQQNRQICFPPFAKASVAMPVQRLELTQNPSFSLTRQFFNGPLGDFLSGTGAVRSRRHGQGVSPINAVHAIGDVDERRLVRDRNHCRSPTQPFDGGPYCPLTFRVESGRRLVENQ